MSARAARSCPFSHAVPSGVKPSSSGRSSSAPASIRMSTTSVYPSSAAIERAQDMLLDFKPTSAPARKSAATISTCPRRLASMTAVVCPALHAASTRGRPLAPMTSSSLMASRARFTSSVLPCAAALSSIEALPSTGFARSRSAADGEKARRTAACPHCSDKSQGVAPKVLRTSASAFAARSR